MIRSGGADHFDPTNLSTFNQEGFSHENAGRSIEARKGIGTAVGQDAGIDGALIEDGVCPNDAALLIDDGIAAAMDVLHNEVVTKLELRKAVHRHGVDGAGGLVCWPRAVGSGSTVFDAVAIFREGIGSSSVNALTVVLLKAGEIAIRDRDEILPGHTLRWGIDLNQNGSGSKGLSMSAMLLGPPPPGLK